MKNTGKIHAILRVREVYYTISQQLKQPDKHFIMEYFLIILHIYNLINLPGLVVTYNLNI